MLCQRDGCNNELTGSQTKWCSIECKRLAYNVRRRLTPAGPGECRYCGATFERKNNTHYFCCPAHKTKWEHENKRTAKEADCQICGKRFTIDNDHKVTCSDECRTRWISGLPLTPDEEIKKQELKSIERRVRQSVGRTKILADLLTQSVAHVNAQDIKPYRPPKAKTAQDPETMVVVLSDHHPGLRTPSYNLDKYHARFEYLLDRLIRIKDIVSKTIPLEALRIFSVGDRVSGQDIYPGQPWDSETTVMGQIYHHAAPEEIRLLMTMAEHFPVVRAKYVPGNHGRTGQDNPDEVNFDTIFAQDIERRFEFVDQIDIEVEWGKFSIEEIYSHKFLLTHGNLVRSWMNIPFYGLVNKGMRWKGSMGPSRKDIQQEIVRIIRDSDLNEGERVEAIQRATSNWNYLVHGHFHVPFNFPWNDFEIIGNGTLVSDDEFALEQLGMSSVPCQQVFGVHPEHGVTWRWPLDLL